MLPIIIFFVLVCAHQYCTAEAQSDDSSETLWDLSSLGVVLEGLIATILLLFIFVLFLKRFRYSQNDVAEIPKSENDTGINPQLLETFPIVLYSSVNKHVKEGDEDPLPCAVCLAEFNDNDSVRVLPQCNHFFHPPCIDAWLSTHVTCPVCRTELNLQHSFQFAISVNTQINGCGGIERV
ncbi:E3 ubiquitin-protein ligase Os03g0188200-like [Vicia villosa]|uniref:E3 ubiquitin-protein ligase Os03g0188200-like n=1 Tax=Vicia villosa TaxID=3911 RepID=UPI00273B9737|nr:E3 ubiquitin-protein ligase Os03g0188200-like [Vicia villosa]